MKVVAILFLFVVGVQAQGVKAIIWDSTNVTLTNVEIDTIHFAFDRKPYQRLVIKNYSATANLVATKPGQAVYVPDSMVVIIDTTNVSGASADSFRIGVAPYNPITGVIIIAQIVYIHAAAATFAALSDGLALGVPTIKFWYGAYAMLIWRGDTAAGVQRVRAAFVRKE